MGEGAEGARGPGSESDSGLSEALAGFADRARTQEGFEGFELPPGEALEFSPVGRSVGDYEIVRRLGRGGMGVVYEARKRAPRGRRVAIKLLRTTFVGPDALQRFQREVDAVGALEHPAIVPVLEACAEGATPYYVMPFVEGMSVRRLVEELRRRTTAPSMADLAAVLGASLGEGDSEVLGESSYQRWVVRVGLRLADALHYAHGLGICHRDVKPANVLITAEGRPVLVDFGLASIEGRESLTQTGAFLGTLEYASPEQLRGERGGPPSDVFSLGATLHELLALRSPFQPSGNGRSPAAPRSPEEAPRPLGEGVPRELRAVLARALALRPARRYASARALALDLRRYLNGEPVRARVPGWFERGWRVVRRYPRSATAALVTVVLVAAGAGRELGGAWKGTREAARALQSGRAAVVRRDALLRRYALAREGGEDAGGVEGLRRAVLRERDAARELFERADRHLDRAEAYIFGGRVVQRARADVAAARLAATLSYGGEFLEPLRVKRLEERLRSAGGARRYAELLRRRGRVRLEGPVEGARIRLRSAADGQVVGVVTAPTEVSLPTGRYLAHPLGDGGAAGLEWPFWVRWEPPERRVDPPRCVRLPAPGRPEPPPGFVAIPGGEVLVERDPPRWLEVGSFWIARHETTWGELEAWRTRFAAAGVDVPLPPPSAEPADHPVRGLTPMQAAGIAWRLELVAPLPEGWSFDLPTRAEWLRAARGGGTRRYPWGDAFDPEAAVYYGNLGVAPGNPSPQPVGTRPRDVSVFGVHDLAGSVAELTRDLYGGLPGEWMVCGGSYRSTAPEELLLDSRRRLSNEPRLDVGVRWVVRPQDPWFARTAAPPSGFHEDFQSTTPPDPASWRLFWGPPGTLPTQASERPPGRFEASRFVLEGGKGHFSQAAEAWRRISVGSRDFRVRVRARFALPPGAVASPQWARRFGVVVREGAGAREERALALEVDALGRCELSGIGWGGAESAGGPAPPVGSECNFLLEVRDGRARGALEGPGVAWEATVGLPPDWTPRFLTLVAPGFVGGRLEVAEVGLELGSE